MTFLFSRGDLKTKLMNIFKATKQHSFNLAKFVAIYKTILVLQKYMNNGKSRNLDTFFAGLVGGYAVFSERNPVNEQIILYVLSRVVASFIPRQPTEYTINNNKPHPPNDKAFAIVATLVWASVMYIFDKRKFTLQSGLVNSMEYLYIDSNHWNSLKTLLWHNN